MLGSTRASGPSPATPADWLLPPRKTCGSTSDATPASGPTPATCVRKTFPDQTVSTNTFGSNIANQSRSCVIGYQSISARSWLRRQRPIVAAKGQHQLVSPLQRTRKRAPTAIRVMSAVKPWPTGSSSKSTSWSTPGSGLTSATSAASPFG